MVLWATPWKLPLAIATGAASFMGEPAGPLGSFSLTVWLTHRRSGRNRYQPPPTTSTTTVAMMMFLGMIGPPGGGGLVLPLRRHRMLVTGRRFPARAGLAEDALDPLRVEELGAEQASLAAPAEIDLGRAQHAERRGEEVEPQRGAVAGRDRRA